MYPYMNEDAMWQRLKDMQAEMENSRLWAENRRPDLARFVRLAHHLGERVWWIAGLAMRRSPRRSRLRDAAGQDREVA